MVARRVLPLALTNPKSALTVWAIAAGANTAAKARGRTFRTAPTYLLFVDAHAAFRDKRLDRHDHRSDDHPRCPDSPASDRGREHLREDHAPLGGVDRSRSGRPD